MCLDGALLADLLAGIGNDNVKREYYLVDAVAVARAAGHRAIAIEGEEAEFQGGEFAGRACSREQALQQRLRAAALAGGVTMTDPATVWLSADTRFATDVTIGPNVRFGPGVSVGQKREIKAFCDIEGARIGKGAIIGPFARIRPGSDVAERCPYRQLSSSSRPPGWAVAPRPTTSPISAIPTSAPEATSAPARSP